MAVLLLLLLTLCVYMHVGTQLGGAESVYKLVCDATIKIDGEVSLVKELDSDSEQIKLSLTSLEPPTFKEIADGTLVSSGKCLKFSEDIIKVKVFPKILLPGISEPHLPAYNYFIKLSASSDEFYNRNNVNYVDMTVKQVSLVFDTPDTLLGNILQNDLSTAEQLVKDDVTTYNITDGGGGVRTNITLSEAIAFLKNHPHKWYGIDYNDPSPRTVRTTQLSTIVDLLGAT